MERQIECVNKQPREDPHKSIEFVGGRGWKIATAEAIANIEAGRETYFVSDGVRRADVVVSQHDGHKYLKTEADGYSPDNLLSLPECP